MSIVRLPIHLKWSGPVEYDLSEPGQRRRVYEIVLREGRAEDVRRYVDPDLLAEELPDLVLPPSIRRAWQDWLDRRRGLQAGGAA